MSFLKGAWGGLPGWGGSLSFVPRAPGQGVSNFTELVLSHLLQDSSFSEAGSNVLRLGCEGKGGKGEEAKPGPRDWTRDPPRSLAV